VIQQGIVTYLDKNDLEDWRELQAEISAVGMRPDAWSAAEITRLNLRELVMEARFRDKYALSALSLYNYSPVTGAVTEADKYDVVLEDE
jgi:hypothetical protein